MWKQGIGFVRRDWSAKDSNGRPGFFRCRVQILLSVCYWKEWRSSELIAQTVVAELVNQVGASGGQDLPRNMFYGAFTAETKDIHHWFEACFRNNKKSGEWKKDGEKKGRLIEELWGKHTKCIVWIHLLTLPTAHRCLWLLNTSKDWFLNSVKTRPQNPQHLSKSLCSTVLWNTEHIYLRFVFPL